MFENDPKTQTAEIIVIGNEVTSGLISETNSKFISSRLNAEGIDVSRITTVGDNPIAITNITEQALARANIVITTGGLGPTPDDITKNVLAKIFESKLVRNEKVISLIRDFFQKRGQEVPNYAMVQADVPDKAEILYNEKGSAPGLLFIRNKKKLYALPGVPLEMKHLLEKYILPEVTSPFGNKIVHRRLHTTGITESDLWTKIGNLGSNQEIVTIASLPSHLGVTIRISVSHTNLDVIEERLKSVETFFRNRIGNYIYGTDEDLLEGMVGKLLKEKELKLSVAESCTGGLICHRLTNIPGSSDYFKEGAIVYSNEAKIRQLGVKKKLIEKYGAVSREVAIAMAKGLRHSAKTDVCLAVTGILGPSGATPNKPVGLTYIALSAKWACECETFLFPQDRIHNKERAAQATFNLLRKNLLKENKTN